MSAEMAKQKPLRCLGCLSGLSLILGGDAESDKPRGGSPSASSGSGARVKSVDDPEDTPSPSRSRKDLSPISPEFGSCRQAEIHRSSKRAPFSNLRPAMRPASSLPTFSDFIVEDISMNERQESTGSTCPLFNLRSNCPEEQNVELAPILEDDDGNEIFVQANAAACVVFPTDSPDSGPTFDLHWDTDERYEGELRWLVNFGQTQLPAGMYSFFFLVGDVRVLSRVYPVVHGMNMAIFSDPLRRYIIGHGRPFAASQRWPSGPDSPNALANPTAPIEAPQENQDKSNMRRRVHSISEGLCAMGDNGAEAKSLNGALRDAAKQPAPTFSAEVFAGLYDSELSLRLHPSMIRGLDWSTTPLGGYRPTNMQLWAGSARVGKAHGQCEDACFVSSSACGVADGVGGMSVYSSFGVDSARLALELMEGARSACHSLAEDPSRPAQEIALEAIRLAENQATSFGASTITVAKVRQKKLGVANLGDSGFMILRRGKQKLEIIARSTEQSHRWNCPYQITRLPPALQKKFPGFARDMPGDADVYTATVQEGDLLLLYTDGVSDNLHDREIKHVCECALPPSVSELMGLPEYRTAPDGIAKALAFAAHERSCDPKAIVPFTNGCRKNGYDYEGGKEDDITVVAAWVLQENAK